LLSADLHLAIDELTEQYRERCLWYLRPDYLPNTHEARLRVLDQIQRHGDREAFTRAAELREWLYRNSNASSVAS
jgi:hypothetical protein